MLKELQNKIAEMSKKELKDFIRTNPHEVGKYASQNGAFAYKIIMMFSETLEDIKHFISLVK